MKLKTTLFFIIIIVGIANSWAQSEMPAYALVSTDFYHKKLSESAECNIVAPHSSDSLYIKIKNNSQLLYKYFNNGIQPIQPASKINEQWQTDDTFQMVNITCFDLEALQMMISTFKQADLFGVIIAERPAMLSLKVKIHRNDIVKVLQYDAVKWLTFCPPAVQEINFVERTNHRVAHMASNFPFKSSLTGRGIVMGIWDGGDVGVHIDFDSRLTLVKKLGINSHATHVAGTMAGAGNLEPDARGMAPEAKIYSWDFNGDIPVEMDTNHLKLGYSLTQNSYGYWTSNCADFALYDGISTEMDRLSIRHKNLLHVFAAGNSRGMNCVSGGYKTILPGFQSAKNTLSVAAVNSIDGDSYFSCAGPTQDGRFKPEISAVGVNVYSTQHNNTYAGGWNGTSMATPGASGTIALLYERFNAKYGYTPVNFLGKNIIANTADDIGNAGPDYLFGYGRINGRAAISLIDSGFWAIDSVANAGAYYDTLYIPAGLNELKVMLTWNDVEVNPSQSPILVNDLDLTITDSAGNVYRPWTCNPMVPSSLAVRKRDSLNNIEQVTIKNPVKGRYIIKVYGNSVPSGNQAFAISSFKEAKGITVVYPDGNESFRSPSSPARSQLIRWDSKGVTGTYNIEFSRDSGTTWQAVATGISNTQNYYTWQNLADTISTGRALIRVSSGSVRDASDRVFNITGQVTGLNATVCDSQVYLRWRTVPKADFYRVQMLKQGKMQEIGTTKDTAFLVRPLNNNQTYWFSVSVRQLNGAESPRTNAINAVPAASTVPPRITVQPKDTNLCYNNVFYQKSKATGSATITAVWQYSKDNGLSWTNLPLSIDSFNSRNYISGSAYLVRRTYNNPCLAPVYTRLAKMQYDTTPGITLYNRDSIICKGSLLKDSVKTYSQTMPVITWYHDSATASIVLQKSTTPTLSFKANRPLSIWAEVTNLCGTIKTKNLSQPAAANGRNEYTLYGSPDISVADTIIACAGQVIAVNPILTGGRPGYQKLIIKTEDSTVVKNSISLKVNKSQTINFSYLDNCYPDSAFKKTFIKMLDPLSADLGNDTMVCYGSNAVLKVKATGGKATYIYQWRDTSLTTAQRTQSMWGTRRFYITVKDNCSERAATDSVTVQVLPALEAKVNSLQDTICNGNTLNLATTVSGGRISTRVLSWSDTLLKGATPSVIPAKTTVYYLTVTDGCSIAAKDSWAVVVRAPLTIAIQKADTFCYGKQVELTAITAGGLVNKHSVFWPSLNKYGNKVTYTPLASIDIRAEVSDGCSVPDASDTVLFNVYGQLKLMSPRDTSTCYGKTLLLKTVSSGGKNNTVKYHWNAMNTQSVYADSFTGKNYNCMITDGCSDTVRKTIAVSVSPKLLAAPLLIRKCSYDSKNIVFTDNAQRPVTYTWDKLPNGKNQTFNDKMNETYRLTLNDACSDTSMMDVRVSVSDFSGINFLKKDLVRKFITVKTDISSFKSEVYWGDGTSTTTTLAETGHAYKDYGYYAVCRILTDDIGCADTACFVLSNPNPEGFSGYTIAIYPNPVKDVLNFTLNQHAATADVMICDAAGKLIMQQNMPYPPYSSFTVPVNGWAPGVYMLRVICNGEVLTVKFVKA